MLNNLIISLARQKKNLEALQRAYLKLEFIDIKQQLKIIALHSNNKPMLFNDKWSLS